MAELKKQKAKRPGRPQKNAYDLVKIILLKEYFQTGERQTSGFASLFKEKLMLSEVPSPRTIGRAYKRDDIQHMLGMVFEMTNAPIAEKETSFSGDGTGLPLSIKQNYANDRGDEGKHSGYDKITVMVSNNFHLAAAFVHAEGTANDSPLFEPLIEKTANQRVC